MQYFSTFDPFLLGAKVEVRIRKGVTAHARLKRGAYQPRNTNIHSSRKMAFSAGKAITLICAMQRIDLSLFCVDLQG